MKRAIELDVDFSETDVWKSLDGYLVISHDQTIGGKNIKTTNYDEDGGLKDITLSNGEAVSTLQQFIDILKSYPDSKTRLEVEIKDPDAADDILNIVFNNDLKERIKCTASNVDVCKKIINRYGSSDIHYFHYVMSGQPNLDWLESNGFMSYGTSGATEAITKEALSRGFQIEPWVIDDVASAKQQMLWGATVLCTNKPRTMKNLISDLKKQREESQN